MERYDRSALYKNSKTTMDLPGQPGEAETTHTQIKALTIEPKTKRTTDKYFRYTL